MENQITITEYIAQCEIARKYPRDNNTCVSKMLEIVSDKSIADKCIYTLVNSDSELVLGGSIRLAEIVVNNWGNIRAGARVINHDIENIHVHGYAYDLETNTHAQLEIIKSLYDHNKQLIIDENIIKTITSVQLAIAFRNIVFKIVPFVFVQKIVDKIKEVILGGLPEQVFEQDLNKLMFTYNVSDEDVVKLFKKSIKEFSHADIILLHGLLNSIENGEINAYVTFGKRKPIKKMKFA